MRIELCSSCETKRLGRKVFEAKRPANPEASRSQFADGQWQLELSNMLAGEAGSKQSGILNSPSHSVIVINHVRTFYPLSVLSIERIYNVCYEVPMKRKFFRHNIKI